MNGGSSACPWRNACKDEQHTPRSRPAETRRAPAGSAGAVVLRQLRLRHLVHRPAQRCRQLRVRLGKPYAILGLDHRALLVHRSALWFFTATAQEQARARPARPAPADGPGDRRLLLPALAADLHLPPTATGRRVRLAVRGTGGLRQALQPGAFAAYRVAGDSVGHVPPAFHRCGPLAGAWLVRADWRVGADHLSTPLYRPPHRRPGRLVVRLAVAG